MSAAELGEQGGSAIVSPALTAHEEMLASIERTGVLTARGSHIPLLPPEVLQAGNERVRAQSEPDEIHKLTIIGTDAIRLDDDPAIEFRGHRTSELLGHMIAVREAVRSDVYMERGFFGNAPTPKVRRIAIKNVLAGLSRIQTTDGTGLLTRLSATSSRTVGIDKFTVTDMRYTNAYKQARRQAAQQLCEAYLHSGEGMPELSEVPALEGAQRALRSFAGGDMTEVQRERFRKVNDITMRMLSHRTEFDRLDMTRSPRDRFVRQVIAETFDESWQAQAACRYPGVDDFFASGYELKAERVEREARAKAICRTCPVQSKCLLTALENREKHGVWGGLNEKERAQLGWQDEL